MNSIYLSHYFLIKIVITNVFGLCLPNLLVVCLPALKLFSSFGFGKEIVGYRNMFAPVVDVHRSLK